MSSTHRVVTPAQLTAELWAVAGSIGPMASAAATKAALDTQARARTKAPVDTGNLRASITVSTSGTSAEVGPEAMYGGFQEFGTSKMSANPYMNPAADEVEPGFVDAVSKIGM